MGKFQIISEYIRDTRDTRHATRVIYSFIYFTSYLYKITMKIVFYFATRDMNGCFIMENTDTSVTFYDTRHKCLFNYGVHCY